MYVETENRDMVSMVQQLPSFHKAVTVQRPGKGIKYARQKSGEVTRSRHSKAIHARVSSSLLRRK